MIIYKLTNVVNRKIYIGMTTHDVDDRIKRHVREAKRRKSGSVLHASIRKHGIDSFRVEVIDQANCIKQLKEKEIYWIEKLKSSLPHGYNMTIGGDGVVSPSRLTLERRSASVKKKYQDDEFSRGHRQAILDYWAEMTDCERSEKISKRRINMKERGTLCFPRAALDAAAALKKTPEWSAKMSKQAADKWSEEGYREKWSKSVRMKKAEVKDTFIRCIDNGLVFSSARSGAEWCNRNGFPKAARNNLSLCVNGKYKSFCGMKWELINAQEYRDSGLEYIT